MSLPQEYQDRLSQINLEIKDYPDGETAKSQSVTEKKSGNIFTSQKSITLFKQPMLDISYSKSELKENIRFAILSQADEVLGLPGHSLLYENSDTSSISGFH